MLNLKMTVDFVNLTKYMGRWYEIARLPTYFEKDCENVVADYSISTNSSVTNIVDMRVKVRNQCTVNGVYKSIDGLARVTEPQTCSKLQVSFAPLLPWFIAGGSYWIINLDQDQYSWAMVGNPQKTCLWILSRDPWLSAAVYSYLINDAILKGFDTSSLIRTNQKDNIDNFNFNNDFTFLTIDPTY
jgi:apolipoprotein D and lipocalin family protein